MNLEILNGPAGRPWTWLPYAASHETLLAEKVLKPWGPLIAAASERFDVPANVIAAVIMTESAGNASEVSHTDAVGLMQLTPKWFPEYPRADFFDPAKNIEIGTRYLAALHKDGNDWPACFSIYACGPKPSRPWRPKEGKSAWGTCAEMAPHGDSVSITVGRANFLAGEGKGLWEKFGFSAAGRLGLFGVVVLTLGAAGLLWYLSGKVKA